jgi:hypothetical protein
MRFGPIVLTVAVVSSSFLLYIARPYSVISDIGYQAFSARQYVEHEVSAFGSVRLVDPHDLSRDIDSSLTFWTPFWTAAYALAFKAGLAPGQAGRILAFTLSLMGALGWLRVSSLLGLKGGWRIAGVGLAALYCLRTSSVTIAGAGDLVIYAAAPWILGAVLSLCARESAHRRWRLASQMLLLCFFLGSVYWLKYSGIFFSIAVFCALILEQFRGHVWPRRTILFALILLCGVSFALPVLANSAWNRGRQGSAILVSTVPGGPARTVARFEDLASETFFQAGTTLFSAEPGADRIAGARARNYQWLIRLPGLFLLAILLYMLRGYSPPFVRNLAVSLVVIPVVGFPILSFVAGTRVTSAIGRCCEPFWIFLELLVFVLLSQPATGTTSTFRRARPYLALAAGIELVLFLWIPFSAVRESWYISHSPAHTYKTGAADLWVVDLSKFGTRDIDAGVKSLIRGPDDVVVPAIYSNRGFGMDTWLELGGRLLPLTSFYAPLMRTHGFDGANYASATPFVSSRPLRVILVASDIFNRRDFPESVRRIKGRFPQAKEWNMGPIDPHGRIQIWVADLQP